VVENFAACIVTLARQLANGALENGCTITCRLPKKGVPVFMLKQSRLFCALLCFILLIVAVASGETNKKIRVKDQSDLPRYTYPMSGHASDLLQADAAAFNAFAAKVRTDLDAIFRDYEIEDKATLRSLLGVKLDLQHLAGEDEAALETVKALRALEEKPSPRLTTGLYTQSVLETEIATRSTSGPVFEKEFAKRYGEAVDSLPWDVVQDWAKAVRGGAQLSSKAVIVGSVKSEIDPAVEKSGVVDNQEAWSVIHARAQLQFDLPLKNIRADVLSHYIDAHNVTKPDIWPAREVTLNAQEQLTPVLVGIWDSGVDVSIYGDQVFTDPHPTASGTHGLAYADDGSPSPSWLFPLTPAQQQQYPGIRAQLKGFADLNNAIDSPEAGALRLKFSTLTSDQINELFNLYKVLDPYIHGTHVAGIAIRGNPAARIVVARFDDQLPDLRFPPTTEWAHKMAADFEQMSDYFRTRNVRVVNMSWGDSPSEFEAWLSKTGAGADPAERKRRALELFKIWHDAVESAIKDAPNTLFICAAGNSDSNAGFLKDVPASLHLPNLIAVGAVNQAGDETSFTSYGDTVVIDADGYNVESYVPGGTKLQLSGTSMASPNVTNLAAKLFALQPSLTPAQAIDLIKRGATTSEDGRRHLIDEKRSVALLQEGK
jgi:subtilisin family serine protease